MRATKPQTRINTSGKLITAAASLLDSGGESAVTLRAVANAVGLSHNAPYKHFKDRGSLLAAVATADFEMLGGALAKIRHSSSKPLTKLRRSLKAFVDYGHKYPARYRLLLSDPDIAAGGGALHDAALRAFLEFAGIVADCQSACELPQIATSQLAGLLFASVHGFIDLDAGGRMRREKGLSSVMSSVDLLLDVLSHSDKLSA